MVLTLMYHLRRLQHAFLMEAKCLPRAGRQVKSGHKPGQRRMAMILRDLLENSSPAPRTRNPLHVIQGGKSVNEFGLGAAGSIGVHSVEMLQALLRDSRTPQLTLAFQALQTQVQSTHNTALQTL